MRDVAQGPAISIHGRHFGRIRPDLDRSSRPRMEITVTASPDAVIRLGHGPASRFRSALQRFRSADSLVPMTRAASSRVLPASTAA